MRNFCKAEVGAYVFNAYLSKRAYRCYDKVPLVLEYLLTDLIHFADAQGVDFEDCLEQARLRHHDDTDIDGAAP
jgi:hypothetical protein